MNFGKDVINMQSFFSSSQVTFAMLSFTISTRNISIYIWYKVWKYFTLGID